MYIGRPLLNDCALDNTNTDLSSDVLYVYRETLLGFPKPSEKNPFGCLVSALHQEQHSGRLLHMYHPNNWVFR